MRQHKSGERKAPLQTRPFLARAWVALAAALVVFAAVGCYDSRSGLVTFGGAIAFKLPAFPKTGSNAVQMFTEMHYQPSYREQEPPRILPAPDSVPVSGAEIIYTTEEEYRQLNVPQPVLDTYDQDRARALYNTNCAVCHDTDLMGDGPIVPFMDRGPFPADLTAGVTRNASNGELYAFISFGGRQGFAAFTRGRESASPMPAFRFLLTEEERWALVHFLRAQIGPPQQ